MKFFVSRQCYWPDGTNMVEIAKGGLDYANADMLVPKFTQLGEGKEFNDPREAVEAALQVRDAWKQVAEDDVLVDMGFTHGFTIPFDGSDDETLRKAAEALYEKLPKCAHCGELLGKQRYGCHDLNEFDCCSEYCAEMRYATPEDEDVEGSDQDRQSLPTEDGNVGRDDSQE